MKNPYESISMAGPDGMLSSVDVVGQDGTIYDTFDVDFGSNSESNPEKRPAAGGSGGSGVGSWIMWAFDKLNDWGLSLYNNRQAEKAATKQYERQLEFWNKQNKYNSYSNQRALAEAAGLNFAAMHSNGSADASASSLSQVPGNEWAKNGAFRAGLGSIASSMLDLKLKQAQINDIEASARLKDSQSGLTGEQTVSQRLQNAVDAASDELVLQFDGNTYTGARLVQKLADSRSSIIRAFDEEIGYRSSKNEFNAREDYDFWRKRVAYDVNVLYSPIQQKLLEANLNLTKKEAELITNQILDIGSQIAYRAEMLGETNRHNEKQEEIDEAYNEAMVAIKESGTTGQNVGIGANVIMDLIMVAVLLASKGRIKIK